MTKNKKIVLSIVGVLLLCLCCCCAVVVFMSQAGYTEVNGICTYKGPMYSGAKCPVVGQPVVDSLN